MGRIIMLPLVYSAIPLQFGSLMPPANSSWLDGTDLTMSQATNDEDLKFSRFGVQLHH